MPIPLPDARLSHDDFVLFPDDGLRHEIIDGTHYVARRPWADTNVMVLRAPDAAPIGLVAATGASVAVMRVGVALTT